MYLFSVFLPLISFFIFIFLSNFSNKKILIYISTFNIILATLISSLLIKDVVNDNYNFEVYLFSWLNSADLSSSWSINFDFLTATMIFIVNIISALVQFYSIGYMEDDKSIVRFFFLFKLIFFFHAYFSHFRKFTSVLFRMGRSRFMFIPTYRFLVL